MQAKRLSYYPFDPVSFHGPSDLPVYTDPNPVTVKVVWVNNQGKTFAANSPALFVNPLKLPSLTQKMIFWELKHLVTIRLITASGPWRDGRSGWRVLRLCSCGSENRVYVYV
jgi:hypothetical protein